MELRKINPVTDKADFEFIERLYIESFPANERRPVLEFRRMAEEGAFTVYLLMDGNTRIGLFTVWYFDNFIYGEHFAVSPEFRSNGYGKQVLATFVDATTLPILVEVEFPDTDMAERRIAFYERAGFKLLNVPYVQPPYESKYEPVPMKLMSYRTISSAKALDAMKEEIYRKVYNSDLV